jgi:hypothetical protein
MINGITFQIARAVEKLTGRPEYNECVLDAPLYSEFVEPLIAQAKAWDNDWPVVLRLNSPGGAVSAEDILALRLLYCPSTKRLRPLIIVVKKACSAGFDLMCRADYVIGYSDSILMTHRGRDRTPEECANLPKQDSQFAGMEGLPDAEKEAEIVGLGLQMLSRLANRLEGGLKRHGLDGSRESLCNFANQPVFEGSTQAVLRSAIDGKDGSDAIWNYAMRLTMALNAANDVYLNCEEGLALGLIDEIAE